jgi:transcriptional regulator with XRE-family HTH domain
MKTIQRNEAVRALRKVIGLTQAEFALLIGVSKDAVVSWETGRNELSETFARRIALATGVDGRALRQGISVPFSTAEDGHIYTKADYDRHQQTELGMSKDAEAKRLEYCLDTLQLLFEAAARASEDKRGQRWPGLMDSFRQWGESARVDFDLGPELDGLLAKRRFRAGMTQEYRDWRAMARGNAEGLAAAGFKDDASKGDKEELRLELELVPEWAPGQSMKPPRPARMKMARRGSTAQG